MEGYSGNFGLLDPQSNWGKPLEVLARSDVITFGFFQKNQFQIRRGSELESKSPFTDSIWPMASNRDGSGTQARILWGSGPHACIRREETREATALPPSPSDLRTLSQITTEEAHRHGLHTHPSQPPCPLRAFLCMERGSSFLIRNKEAVLLD